MTEKKLRKIFKEELAKATLVQAHDLTEKLTLNNDHTVLVVVNTAQCDSMGEKINLLDNVRRVFKQQGIDNVIAASEDHIKKIVDIDASKLCEYIE